MLATDKPDVGESDPEIDPHNVQSIADHAVGLLEWNAAEPFFLYLTHKPIREPIMGAAGGSNATRATDGSRT